MSESCPACNCVGYHADDCPAKKPDAYYDLWLVENQKVAEQQATIERLQGSIVAEKVWRKDAEERAEVEHNAHAYSLALWDKDKKTAEEASS
jgi:hypothetical protein